MVTDETPLIITMCIMAFGICGLAFLKVMYKLENKRRAREIASWGDEQFIAEANSMQRRGDQKRTFMYGT
jgi:hypothetical protein